MLSILLVVTIAFMLVHLTPGGPAFSILGMHSTPNQVAALNKQLGLTLPLWTQYALWWRHLLHGSFGYSYNLHRPVSELLLSYEGNTIVLYSLAIMLAVLLSILIGLVQGMVFLRPLGTVLGLVELGLYGMPGFFLGTMLVLLFCNRLGWLPPSGITDLRLAEPTLGSYASHLVLPVLTVTLVAMSGYVRYFAQSVHEELAQDYVRSVLARGGSYRRALLSHVMRNALRPLVTLLGLSFPAVFVGGTTVEVVFSYPGLGWLLWHAAQTRDYPIMVAIVLAIGVLTIVGNLLADLVNALLDPRIRYE